MQVSFVRNVLRFRLELISIQMLLCKCVYVIVCMTYYIVQLCLNVCVYICIDPGAATVLSLLVFPAGRTTVIKIK